MSTIARAKQYLLTGDVITAPEAAAIGLINFSVPREELDPLVDAWAARLARGATQAVRTTKATINVGLKQLASAMMDTGLGYEGLTSRTSDYAEAIAATRGKRAPRFSGS